jgi:hypothetical protein
VTDATPPGDWERRLPVEFDHAIYVDASRNPDLATFDEARARQHYESWGRTEGRICSAIRNRGDFLGLVPSRLPILEVGPFFSPAFRRPEANVSYLDRLSTESMKKRAAGIKGATADTVPEIDYVWSGERYSDLVKRKFPAVFSSHNIEHQPCLITHLQDLESVLAEDGALFLVVPDKRYCFDHFFPESTLSDVVEAWADGAKKHRVKDVLDHRFFPAHNDPVRHWQKDHGVNLSLARLQGNRAVQFLAAVEGLRSSAEYADVHAWKFTPAGFRVLFENLYSLKLTELRTIRLYPTVKNSNEFYAVLARARR